MAAPEYHRAYRRGIVLGLSLAELFILLVFLLLLALIGYALSRDDQANRQEQTIAEQQEQLDALAPIIDADPSELEQRKLIARLAREKSDAEKRAEEAEQQVKMFRNENTSLHEEKEAWQKEREILTERAETSEKIANQTRKELQKGQNPPCWYKTVNEEGKTREKSYYLFNIAVYDNHMIVLRRPAPPGRADDDNGLPYIEEANQIGLDKIPYNTPLTDVELDEYMRSIHNLGKDGKVRSYSCIFYARVWDETSDIAKERWQNAHDVVLEGLFGTYRVDKNEPWPEPPYETP